MRFRKTFRRPFRRFGKRVVPDVLPIQVCETPITPLLATNDSLDFPQHCGAMFPGNGNSIATTATMLLDGGNLVALGSQLNGISKGFKFRSLTAQYDFLSLGHPSLDCFATIFHAVIKVKMGQDVDGARVPLGFPNLMSQYDSEVGEILWRRQERFFIPRTVVGTNIGLVSLQAGTVRNSTSASTLAYTPSAMPHSTTMKVSSRRNLREDEALLWIQQGYVYDIHSMSTLISGGLPNMYCSMYGRMVVSNWQS